MDIITIIVFGIILIPVIAIFYMYWEIAMEDLKYDTWKVERKKDD